MKKTVHVQLGRMGDLLILLPCWRQIWLNTGEKPIVVVAREFSNLFKGVSYVEVDAVNGHWYGEIMAAAKMAQLKYGKYQITQCHGVGHETDQRLYPSFGEAMWSKAGFEGKYGTLPLIFDRRNYEREGRLINAHRRTGKPVVLFNFSGLSSPMKASQAVRNRLRRYEMDYEMIALSGVRADYLYDLLGLYDIAAGLITIDTSTAHLALASPVRTLAYCRDGWSGMIPKRDAIKILYSEAQSKLDMVDEFMQSLKYYGHDTESRVTSTNPNNREAKI